MQLLRLFAAGFINQSRALLMTSCWRACIGLDPRTDSYGRDAKGVGSKGAGPTDAKPGKPSKQGPVASSQHPTATNKELAAQQGDTVPLTPTSPATRARLTPSLDSPRNSLRLTAVWDPSRCSANDSSAGQVAENLVNEAGIGHPLYVRSEHSSAVSELHSGENLPFVPMMPGHMQSEVVANARKLRQDASVNERMGRTSNSTGQVAFVRNSARMSRLGDKEDKDMDHSYDKNVQCDAAGGAEPVQRRSNMGGVAAYCQHMHNTVVQQHTRIESPQSSRPIIHGSRKHVGEDAAIVSCLTAALFQSPSDMIRSKTGSLHEAPDVLKQAIGASEDGAVRTSNRRPPRACLSTHNLAIPSSFRSPPRTSRSSRSLAPRVLAAAAATPEKSVEAARISNKASEVFSDIMSLATAMQGLNVQLGTSPTVNSGIHRSK